MPSAPRGTGAFFGELYLRSTRPFLVDHVTQAEGRYLSQHLAAFPLKGPVLDLGCGHGRHLRTVDGTGRALVGVDFDALSLKEAKQAAPVARGDFFALPFRTGSFAAAWSWYNTPFTFEDGKIEALLREVARCLKPGGLLIVQGTARAHAQALPDGQYDGVLPDGCRLVETCHYDDATGRDNIDRELTTPEGRRMGASFFIRYFFADELIKLLAKTGFDGVWVHGGVDGYPPASSSTELIVGAARRGTTQAADTGGEAGARRP